MEITEKKKKNPPEMYRFVVLELKSGCVSKPLFSMAVIYSLLHFTFTQTMNSSGKGPSPLL